MKLVWGLFLAIFFVFLVSCTKQDTPTSLVIEQVEQNFVKNFTVEETSIEDPCKKISCPTNRACSEGTCICKQGTKECNKTCISINNCCNDDNCKVRESCVNAVCVKKAKCDYLQEFNPKTGKCDCIAGSNYCVSQKKCIPLKNCCNFDNCNPVGGDEKRCTDTQFLAEICVSDQGNTACKLSSLGKKESVTISQRYFEVLVEKIFEDKEVELKVFENKQEIPITELKPGEEVIVPFAKLKYNDVSIRGGNCKSDY